MPDLDLPQLVALAAVLGFASGIRLYAVILAIGLAGAAGWLELPPGLQPLSHPWVIAVAALLSAAEFFVDKVPALDSLWDAVHTFVRVPAGAALAAAVLGGDSTVWTVVAALTGGSLAATSHLTKAGARAAINTSPEPVSNVAASTAEDLLVAGLLALVLAHPLVAFAAVLVLVALALWLLPKVFRFARRVLRRLAGTDGARAIDSGGRAR
jgi:hypothetical protein